MPVIVIILLSIAGICMSSTSSASGSIGRNPFYLQDELDVYAQGVVLIGPRTIKPFIPLLEATFISGKQNMALINGAIVRVGDMVRDYKLVEIQKDFVRLQDSTQEDAIILHLPDLMSKKEKRTR